MDGYACRIVVVGELGPRFERAFEGLTVTAGNGETAITGVVADRTALRGLLNLVDDLGLTLVEVSSAAKSSG